MTTVEFKINNGLNVEEYMEQLGSRLPEEVLHNIYQYCPKKDFEGLNTCLIFYYIVALHKMPYVISNTIQSFLTVERFDVTNFRVKTDLPYNHTWLANKMRKYFQVNDILTTVVGSDYIEETVVEDKKVELLPDHNCVFCRMYEFYKNKIENN